MQRGGNKNAEGSIKKRRHGHIWAEFAAGQKAPQAQLGKDGNWYKCRIWDFPVSAKTSIFAQWASPRQVARAIGNVLNSAGCRMSDFKTRNSHFQKLQAISFQRFSALTSCNSSRILIT